MAKKSAQEQPKGVLGTGFTVEQWEKIEALADKDDLIFSLVEVVKVVFTDAHIQSYGTMKETIQFINDEIKNSIKQYRRIADGEVITEEDIEEEEEDDTKGKKKAKPKVRTESAKIKDQITVLNSITAMAEMLPKFNMDLVAMRKTLFSSEDEGQITGSTSLTDKWANERRQGTIS